jgi:trehalose 6-phosphate phosphatase
MSDLLRSLQAALPAARWLIALDRDGTLVPYAARPEDARVDEHLTKITSALAQQPGFHIAVISARSVAQLRGDFDGQGIILAGNYGMEVRFPDGRQVVQPHALRAVPYLKLVRDQLATILDLESGVILEDHGYSLCLHWHQVPLSRRDEVHMAIQALSQDFSQVRFRALPTSYEVVPNIPWDKGLALSFLDANISTGGVEPLYFYAGDTDADVPAFEWVNERGGISVRVGGSTALGAKFHLLHPEDLQAVLKQLANKRAELSAA